MDALDNGEDQTMDMWDALKTAGGGSISAGSYSSVEANLTAGTVPYYSLARRRLLAYVSTQRPVKTSSFQLVYTSTRDGNVLTKDFIDFALDLEKSITYLPGYASDICFQYPDDAYL